MKFIFVFIISIGVIANVQGLKCYTGTYTMGTPESHMTAIECGEGLDYCLHGYSDDNDDSFHICYTFEAGSIVSFDNLERNACVKIEQDGQTGTICTCNSDFCNGVITRPTTTTPTPAPSSSDKESKNGSCRLQISLMLMSFVIVCINKN